jgi:hypothetical protein
MATLKKNNPEAQKNNPEAQKTLEYAQNLVEFGRWGMKVNNVLNVRAKAKRYQRGDHPVKIPGLETKFGISLLKYPVID